MNEMTLAPAVTVVFGNLKYDVQLPQVDVTLRLLPGVNSFTAWLPSGVEISAVAGEVGVLELDGGEGAETIITGKVWGFRRRLMGTEVTVTDGGSELSRFRPAATYEKQSAKEIIRALANDANVSVGSLGLDLPLAAYTAHQRRSAAEHIAELATLAGAIAYFDSEGELQVAMPSDRPDLALRYTREILSYDVQELSVSQARQIAVGNGSAGSSDAPDALRQSLERLPSDAPDPGIDAVWKPTPLLRTPKTAVAASQAAENAIAAGASRISAHCFLLPALRPGMVIEVQDLPNDLSSGSWLVTHVTHRLHPDRGGTTHFQGTSTASGGLGGLLGAALSAVGGLL